MSLLALHINDASVSASNADGTLYREPGFALLEDGNVQLGEYARARSRLSPRQIQNSYWMSLSTDAIKDRRFAHWSTADLVSRQLEQLWSKAAATTDRVVIAVPPYMQNDQLSLLLGIAAELGIPIAGLVDAAVAATRREYRQAVLVHVDLSLHTTMLTRLLQTSAAQSERSVVIDSAGLSQLGDAWIRKISDAFVHQSRFDPLHTADTEQMLLDRLPTWLERATGTDRVMLDVEYRGIRHEAEIESLDLIAAAAPVYQRIVSQLRALLRAGEVPALQLTGRAAAMPGLADSLKARVGGDIFLLERGATTRGILARCNDMRAGGEGISLVRQLPWDQSAIDVSVEQATVSEGQPTHVLYRSVAYPITAEAIVLGSQAPAEGRCIDLNASMPGVSRRHCSVVRRDGQSLLEDHSRYGTFLNGHRIDRSTVLQSGDVIRLGTPGVELQLIRAVD